MLKKLQEILVHHPGKFPDHEVIRIEYEQQESECPIRARQCAVQHEFHKYQDHLRTNLLCMSIDDIHRHHNIINTLLETINQDNLSIYYKHQV